MNEAYWSQCCLLVFMRNPVPGKVKTRLAAELGEELSLQIYRRLLHRTREVALEVPVSRYLFYDSFINEGDEWPAESFHKKLQAGTDLGERMLNAFDLAFSDGFRKIILIGSDCPELNADLILEGFRSLRVLECCIGPAFDGGYYLIGMNQPLPGLFSNINWGSMSVYKETLKVLANQKLALYKLKTLRDVDTADDYKVLIEHLKEQ